MHTCTKWKDRLIQGSGSNKMPLYITYVLAAGSIPTLADAQLIVLSKDKDMSMTVP